MSNIADRLTLDEARKVLAINEEERKRMNGNGRASTDRIAELYSVSRGEGLTIYCAAQKIVARADAPDACPHCEGTGKKRQEPLRIPTVSVQR